MFGSILSIIFGLLCRIPNSQWLKVHFFALLDPTSYISLQFLAKRTYLFYYLYATPSLCGGAAALAFFVAVCAFTWLEESTARYGWEARAAAIILSGVLIGNATICFVLGAVVISPEPGAMELGELRHGGTEGRQVNGTRSGAGLHGGSQQLEPMQFQDLRMPSTMT